MDGHGYIIEDQARKAIELPIKMITFDKVQIMDVVYYAEKVRDEVMSMFGKKYFYTAGLTILTCVDSKI